MARFIGGAGGAIEWAGPAATVSRPLPRPTLEVAAPGWLQVSGTGLPTSRRTDSGVHV